MIETVESVINWWSSNWWSFRWLHTLEASFHASLPKQQCFEVMASCRSSQHFIRSLWGTLLSAHKIRNSSCCLHMQNLAHSPSILSGKVIFWKICWFWSSTILSLKHFERIVPALGLLKYHYPFLFIGLLQLTANMSIQFWYFDIDHIFLG